MLRHRASYSLLLIAILVSLDALCVARAAQDPGDPLFRAASDIVLVPASVTDARGRLVATLTQDDFLLMEDNSPRRIDHFIAERAPVSVGMIMDASGSMIGARFVHARSALIHFAESLKSGDEIFLQTFSDYPTLVMPWTSSVPELIKAFDVVKPFGSTALFRAVSNAYGVLKSGRNVRKALILLSDGNDNESDPDIYRYSSSLAPSRSVPRSVTESRLTIQRLQAAVQQAQRSATTVYAVAIDTGAGDPREAPLDVDKLRLLTDATGGYTEIVSSSADIAAAVARIGEELRAQYLIGFQSAAKPDGNIHTIALKTRNAQYKVRARSVFVAAK